MLTWDHSTFTVTVHVPHWSSSSNVLTGRTQHSCAYNPTEIDEI
jgi:hypothetical protein